MKFFLLLLVLFLTNNSISFSFQHYNFCRKVNSFKKCADFDCGSLLCSKNKETCKNLVSWGFLMKKYSKVKTNKFTKFIGSIKPCIKEYRNQWAHRMNFG